MWWSFCAAKDGVGTSTIVAAVALELAKSQPELTVVIADFGGDQPELFGIDVAGRPGVTDWLHAGSDAPIEALDNVVFDAAPGVVVLPVGQSQLHQADPTRVVRLAEGFGPRTLVVADLGVMGRWPTDPRALLAAGGSTTTLVTRACYLGLRRAAKLPISFGSVVEVCEPGRSLKTLDVELVLGQPMTARVRVDPMIARAVDAGMLTSRLPRPLRRVASKLIGTVVDDVQRVPSFGAVS